MARYNLIISDKTFKNMLDYGARHNKTVGKLINEVLNAYNWKEEEPSIIEAKKVFIANPCSICGHESTMTLKHIKGALKLFCPVCGKNALDSKKWHELDKTIT